MIVYNLSRIFCHVYISIKMLDLVCFSVRYKGAVSCLLKSIDIILLSFLLSVTSVIISVICYFSNYFCYLLLLLLLFSVHGR